MRTVVTESTEQTGLTESFFKSHRMDLKMEEESDGSSYFSFLFVFEGLLLIPGKSILSLSVVSFAVNLAILS